MTWSVTAKLRDYAQLTRVSNLPTVVSNVLVGGAIGTGAGAIDWPGVAVAGSATALLYLGGMALNDAVDAGVDQHERPQRPIPSGRVTLVEAYTVAAVAFGLSLGLLAMAGASVLAVGLVLLALIVGYNVLHKHWAGSVVLMGLCRGWVYALAAVAVSRTAQATGGGGTAVVLSGAWQTLIQHGPELLWLGGILTAYTMAFSVIARAEAQPVSKLSADRIHGLVIAVPGLPVLALMAILALKPTRQAWAIAAGLVMAAWLGRAGRNLFHDPPRVKAYVMGAISGMSLVDAYFLCLLDRPMVAAGAVVCFVLTMVSQRAVSGT